MTSLCRLPTRAIVTGLVFVLASIASLRCSAQLYETPATRAQKAEALRQEQQKREPEAGRPAPPDMSAKRAAAEAYIGRTYWYIPNPAAQRRIRFYDKFPTSSFSEDPDFLFTPLTITSFVVTGAKMPLGMYEQGRDEFLLEIEFPDGKTGFVNIGGCCGVVHNLYTEGRLNVHSEYVTLEPAHELLEREAKLHAERRLAEERVARLEQEAKDKAARELQATLDRLEKERTKRAAMPPPRINMSTQQVVNGTRWGVPQYVNRTTTARGVREQWVYGGGRYLYFDNGILVAIQD